RYSHQFLIDRRPPDGTIVWLSAYKDPTRAAAAWKRAYRFPTQAGDRAPDPNAYAITFTALRVVFHVLGHFSAGSAALQDEREGIAPALLRIWPLAGSSVEWPPPFVFSDESIDLLVNSIVDGTEIASES